MTQIIDVSVPLGTAIPTWPGSPGFSIRALKSHEADGVAASEISMDVHTGTHLDAPAHFLPDGQPMSSLAMDVLVGPAWVMEQPDGDITADSLARAGIPSTCSRLLISSGNSRLWKTEGFVEGYQALTASAAEWVVSSGIRLVGIDYLSIQRYSDDPTVHIALLEAGVAILEGLNLTSVDAGEYRLICLPISIPGAEAAPARAVLEVIE